VRDVRKWGSFALCFSALICSRGWEGESVRDVRKWDSFFPAARCLCLHTDTHTISTGSHMQLQLSVACTASSARMKVPHLSQPPRYKLKAGECEGSCWRGPHQVGPTPCGGSFE